MEHRPALNSDIDRIMDIIKEAQLFLREKGVNQWQDGYPSRELCENDIKKGCCRVFLVNGTIAGIISVFYGCEECYEYIEDGAWLTGDMPYAVFHRTAVGKEYRGTGVAERMLDFAENSAAEKGFGSIRGDTHYDNVAMRRLLEKRGFVHCGTIYVGSEKTAINRRACYEKIL